MKRTALTMAALLAVSLATVVSDPSQAASPVPDKAFSAHKAFDYARKGGRSVEITSLTTATTRAWANPDGRATAELSAAPVRMKRAGQWVDFDLTLSRRPDGSIAPNVHPHQLTLAGAKGVGEHDLATVDVGGERLGLRWLGSLPQPTLTGSKATYSEVAPGIDLIVEARTSGFEQFLVVKERAAAARVAGLRLSMRAGSGRFDAATGVWHSSQGRALARMPAALMWDAQGFGPDGERRRKAKVGLKDTVVAPDLAWMLDAATQYPVTIDPGLDVDARAGFDEFVQNTINLSDNQSSGELKLGYADSGDCMAVSSQGCRARSYVRFDGLAPFAGATIQSARLHLLATHSWSCSAFGWRATRTSWVDGNVQWGSQPDWYEFGPVSGETRGYNASCDDAWVSTDVAPLMDDIFAAGQDSLALAVHADGDNNRDSWTSISHDSWKKFASNETGNGPRIYLTYNHIPRAVNPELEQDGSCGAGAAARKNLVTTEPTFRARVEDPDSGNHVQIEVEVTPIGGTASTRRSLSGAPGGIVSVAWTGLDQSKVYKWRLRPIDIRASDGAVMDYGPWSPLCEFAFDTTSIQYPPIVEGIPTVVQDGETFLVLDYGQPARLTFKAQPVDLGKIAGYRYGFDQASVESLNAPTVLAKSDGTATAVITNWQVDSMGAPISSVSLHVRAVSVTGTKFSHYSQDEVFQQLTEAPPASHIAGDFGGDGKADLTGVRALNASDDLLYVMHGAKDGSLSRPANLLKLNYGAAHQFAQGDFNGDGKSDFASLVASGTSNSIVKAIQSDGNSLRETEVWNSITGGGNNAWPYAKAKLIAGDVTNDGRDDLIVALGDASNTTYQLKVFKARATAAIGFDNPVNWLSTPRAGNVANLKLVIGSFDAAAGQDIGVFEDMGNCRTRLVFHNNVGTTSFSAGAVAWDYTGWCWADSQFVAGNFDTTTGRTGIVAAAFNRNLPGCHTDIYTFTSPFNSFVTQWRSTTANQYWCADRVELALRDVAGDSRADLLVSYRDSGAFQQQVWLLTANGSAGGPDTFADPVQKMRGGLGPLGTRDALVNPRGDVNNDDYADLGFLFVHNGFEATFMTAYGTAGGMNPPTTSWSLPSGSWNANNVMYTSGDFNGDGRKDAGFYYSYGDDSGWFDVSFGTANGPGPLTRMWTAPIWAFNRGHMQIQAGDFNGDGRDDLGIFYGYDDYAVGYFIAYSTATGMNYPVAAWYLGPNSWDRSRVFYVVGDYNGDGKDDAGFYYSYPDDSGWFHVYFNTANGTGGTTMFSIGVQGWHMPVMKMCSGDFNGDGKDDLAVLYTYFDGRGMLMIGRGQANNQLPQPEPVWMTAPGTQSYNAVTIACNDYNGDGLDDMGIMRTEADLSATFWVSYSTSTGAAAPVHQWSKVSAWGLLPNAQLD